MPAGAAPERQLARLMDGFVVTQALHVAARLDVAGALARGPRTGPDIAAAVGADAGALTRVLRCLSVEGVLDERDDGTFALTPVGAALPTFAGPIAARAEVYYGAAAGLLDAVRDGGTAFERVHGERFFAHLERHPDREAAFQSSMAARAEGEARDVLAAYDFAGLDRIVDVGGGTGALLGAILRAHPALHGELVDRPAALARARRRLEDDGVADRVQCREGDFFAAVPGGRDAYLLSRVIHDWDDADSVRILSVCRTAMGPSARLLLIDVILPERAGDAPEAVRMDLHMLILFGARERTAAGFRELLATAGLGLRRVVPTGAPDGLAVIEATPA